MIMQTNLRETGQARRAALPRNRNGETACR